VTEPAVTLTDYGLAIENAVFAYLLRTGAGGGAVTRRFAVFFAAGAAAALAGGTVHGFFLDAETIGARLLWPATLIAVGICAAAAWAAGARLALPPGPARVVTIAAGVDLAVYAAVVLFVTRAFVVAVVNALPAAAFLLAAFVLRHRRTGERAALVAALGLGLTFAAAGVQVGRVGLDPVLFDHNALYHVVQAAALLLLFIGARRLRPAAPEGHGPC